MLWFISKSIYSYLAEYTCLHSGELNTKVQNNQPKFIFELRSCKIFAANLQRSFKIRPFYFHGAFPFNSSSFSSTPISYNCFSNHRLSFFTHYMNAHLYHHSTNLISSIFYSCNDLKTLKQIHAYLVVSDGINNHETATEIAPKLISLYAKFSGSNSSFAVLKSMKKPNTFLWNLSIKALVNSGDIQSAFYLYKQMREIGVEHDSYTFPILNQAVLLSPESYWFGKIIHGLAFRMGFASDVYFCNTMIEAYVKDRSFRDARKLFSEMPYRDMVSWTTTISGYVCEGNVFGAFRLFRKMPNEVEPNAVTMLVMLQAFPDVSEAKQFHSYLTKNGWLSDRSVGNALLKTYTDLGSVVDAEILFGEMNKRDIVSWNVMFSLYSARGEILMMTTCFSEMQEKGEVKPSSETLTMFLSGLVVRGGNLYQGGQIHCLAMKKGLCDDKLRTSLIDFYAKCGEVESSAQLFGEICYSNYITWNAMISGFFENGLFKEAITLFKQMLAAGFPLAIENLATLLAAYTRIGAIQLGKGVHGYAIRNLFLDSGEGITTLETSILNMYVRCGSISAARNCFDRMATKDIVAWTSMIEGNGIHGLGFEALDSFWKMVEEGIEPNGVTFLSLLAACSHSGLVREGCRLLYSMKWNFNIEPDLDHYTCIVDLLGRSGRLKDALAVIVKLVTFPDSSIWGSLLAASGVHVEKRLGEYAARKLLELEVDNVGYYTLLSNIQASAEKWTEVEEVRCSMKARGLIKWPGWSCIETKGMLQGFISGDRSHPCSADIQETLRCLIRMAQDADFVPCIADSMIFENETNIDIDYHEFPRLFHSIIFLFPQSHIVWFFGSKYKRVIISDIYSILILNFLFHLNKKYFDICASINNFMTNETSKI